MEQYTIPCTSEQTKKTLELGAPIKIECFSTATEDHWHEVIPTAEQMIGWLERQGVKCFVLPDMYDDDSYNIQINNKLITTGHPQYNYPLSYNSRKDATLAVIDVALDYLTNNKK